jgi:uncharacterized membrane protein YukC
MVIMTFTVISVILLLTVGLFVIGSIIWEVEKGFVYFAWGMIALLICVAAYLTYAVPSFANNTKPAASAAPATAQSNTQQDTVINLLQE